MIRFAHVLVALAFVAAACAGDEASEPGTAFTVTYDGTDCAYEGADTLAAGTVDLTFVNDSDEDVGLSTRKLVGDYTWDDFVATTSDEEQLEVSTSLSWLNRAFEGKENRGELMETVTVTAGTVALLCVKFAPNDGPPSDFYNVQAVDVIE